MTRARNALARRLAAGLLLVFWTAGLIGCAGFQQRSSGEIAALRVSDHLADGDAARRASMQLVARGLDADLSGDFHRALGEYERAISVDANNPYAYLALARHSTETGDTLRAEAFLDRAELLFASEGELTPPVRVHIVGMRGQLGASMSPPRAGAVSQRREAARMAPDIWGDGRLSPDELL